MSENEPTRRSYLKLAGSAAAAVTIAGCTGGGGDDTTTGSGGDTSQTDTSAETSTEATSAETSSVETTAGGRDTTGGVTSAETTGNGANTSETSAIQQNTSESGNGTAGDTATNGSDASNASNNGGGGGGEFAVTITQGQMPSGLDPQDHRETPTDNVVLHAYEGVLARDAKGKIIEKLATDYKRVEKGRVRFSIREDVTFHNGDDLTPEDVAYSINRMVKNDVGFASPQKDQLPGVTGAKVVDGKRAVDVMSDGFNPIVFASFGTYADVMQKSWVKERSKDQINQQMNGTGPFKLDNYEQNVNVVFSRYEDYWRDPADISKLTFNAAKESSTRVNQLLQGETDVAVNVPPQDAKRVRSGDSASLSAVPSTRVLFNAMRYDVEPFSNQSFRQAMNYAIDLKSIIENVLSGFADPTGQPTLEGFVGYNGDLEVYPQDTDKAESLVKDSGFDGAEITLETPVGRYLKDVEIAQAVANQIDSLSNVSCSVKQREFSALAGEVTDGKISTSPHFYLLGWGNATFDASQTIIPLLTTDGALTSYSNDTVDSAINNAQTTSDEDKRKSTLQDANATIHDQSPWIFLNRQYSVYGVSKRVDWSARRDERINAYAMSPTN